MVVVGGRRGVADAVRRVLRVRVVDGALQVRDGIVLAGAKLRLDGTGLVVVRLVGVEDLQQHSVAQLLAQHSVILGELRRAGLIDPTILSIRGPPSAGPFSLGHD